MYPLATTLQKAVIEAFQEIVGSRIEKRQDKPMIHTFGDAFELADFSGSEEWVKGPKLMTFSWGPAVIGHAEVTKPFEPEEKESPEALKKSLAMDRMSLKTMPADVQRSIFEFDDTYKEMFSRTVLTDRYFSPASVQQMYLDRAYTIRNWPEEGWAIVPRYILRDNGKVYGSYIRGSSRSKEPL